jgi:4'-phosphopantetheinyl transferase
VRKIILELPETDIDFRPQTEMDHIASLRVFRDEPARGTLDRVLAQHTPEEPHGAAPSALPALDADNVHVWSASFARLAPRIDVFRSSLAPCEHARAARFVSSRDRAHATIARGILRTLLARYLHVEPASLQFVLGPLGRPALCPAKHVGAPVFSLSHSGDVIVLAVAGAGAVLGIDVERHRDMPQLPGIASRCFHAAEASELAALPMATRTAAFFDCWTRKEAVVKALGLGLSRTLSDFRVSLLPGQPARLLDWEASDECPENWALQALTPAAGYSCAVAAKGLSFSRLRCWNYQGP